MIAQRFQSVVWVAGVAAAATMLYIISAQVAAERGRLEAIDAQIAGAKDDIRQLQTEMEARASLRQLERWNGEALALAAPAANQYVDGEAGISQISTANLGKDGVAPPPVMASVFAKPIEPVSTETVEEEGPGELTHQDRLVQQAVEARPVKAVAASQPVAKPSPAKNAKPMQLASAKPVTRRERSLDDIIKSVEVEVRQTKASKQ